MKYQLSYLIIEKDNKKTMKFEKELDKSEYNLIVECNGMLGSFNMFYDYFDMLEINMNELINYINKAKSDDIKLSHPVTQHKLFVELNRLMINFSSMFRTFLAYHERFIKEVYVDEKNGDVANELTEFKKNCSKRFDEFFEYRFLYNIRHYTVKYKQLITKMVQNEKKTKKFYIDIEELKKWSGWSSHVKKDIQALKEDIDVELFMNDVKKILADFKNDIVFISDFEVIGAINILSKYIKPNSKPYITIPHDDNETFDIQPLFDELFVTKVNLRNLGVGSRMIWNKEKGMVLYDPYNMQFTKEEKERFGLPIS